jgi:hypothetical protein
VRAIEIETRVKIKIDESDEKSDEKGNKKSDEKSSEEGSEKGDEEGIKGSKEADISVNDATGETGLGRRDCKRDCKNRFPQGRITDEITGRSNRKQQITGNATTACNNRKVRINIIMITEVLINKINKKVSINKTRQHTTVIVHVYKSNAIAPWSPM